MLKQFRKGITKLIIENNFEKIFSTCLGMHLYKKIVKNFKWFYKGFNFGDKSVVSVASNSIQRVHTGWNYVKFTTKDVISEWVLLFSHSFGILWTGEKDEIAFYEQMRKSLWQCQI